jgi:hypothetical protein
MKVRACVFAAVMICTGTEGAHAGAPLDWHWMQQTSCRTLLHMKKMPPLARGTRFDKATISWIEMIKDGCRNLPPKTCIIDFIGGRSDTPTDAEKQAYKGTCQSGFGSQFPSSNIRE